MSNRVKQLVSRFKKEWKEVAPNHEIVPSIDADNFDSTPPTIEKVCEQLVSEGVAKETNKGYKLIVG